MTSAVRLVSNTRRAISQRRGLTAIKPKYCSTFLATRCASVLRVIGSRFLFQYFVEIFYGSQCVTTQPEKGFLPGPNCWTDTQGT